MWQLTSQSSSSPGCVWVLTAVWFDIVPEGTNSAASLPSRAATRSSRRLTVGSSWKTSSPTSAACMAARMAGVGRVTVSLRRSMYSGMFLPSVVEPLHTRLVADGHGLCYTAHLIKLRHNSCLLFLSLPLQER